MSPDTVPQLRPVHNLTEFFREALDDALVVVAFGPSHQLAFVRQEECAFDVEETRRE